MNKPQSENRELLRKIQELSFVKTEIELFLDTHPNSRVALDSYKEVIVALRDLVTRYQAEYGPITAEGGAMGDRWSWVDKPWPWQHEDREEREAKN
jgi:spore coat protein JB